MPPLGFVTEAVRKRRELAENAFAAYFHDHKPISYVLFRGWDPLLLCKLAECIEDLDVFNPFIRPWPGAGHELKRAPKPKNPNIGSAFRNAGYKAKVEEQVGEQVGG